MVIAMKAFKKIKYLLKLMYKVSPSYIFLTIFGSLFQAMLVVGNVVLPKFLIDELVQNKNYEMALYWGLIIVCFNLLINIINKTYKRILEVKQSFASFKVMQEMSLKIMKVEYKYLEDPYYLDLKERAIFACNNQGALQRVVVDFSNIITHAITLISLITVMLYLGVELLAILFIGVFITLMINKYFMKYQVNYFSELIPINRKFSYYFGLTFDEKLSKDMRLYDMSPLILKRVRYFNNEILNNFEKFYIKLGIVTGSQSFITAIQTGIVYFYIAYRVSLKTAKKITIGDFTMYANSAINFTKTFDSLFSNYLDIKQVLNYLDPFVEFMQLPDAVEVPSTKKLGPIETIEFRGVSFTYPKTNKIILDNVSFKINKGEKISIVGLNGAGKTTIVKLLCRFYKPDSGEILINGVNIEEYDYKSYLNELAIVFQDYKLFAYSILKNITNDDNVAKEEINQILDKVGLSDRVKELPNGIDTTLNKSFDDDGIELSGGQGQKLAIARALYKNSSLVILDEPTSALDPIAEAEIYEHFNDLVLDKTAIYISHRMSSSVFCDYILVLDGGKVSAFDSHQNLMKDKDSLYYKLYTIQSKNYQYN